jgi:hypothetical protein
MSEKMAARLIVPVYDDYDKVRTDKTGSFESRRLPFGNEWIFECTESGCLGCGCPAFVIGSDDSFPDEILEHLKTHAQFCRGLFPPTAPSQGLDPERNPEASGKP